MKGATGLAKSTAVYSLGNLFTRSISFLLLPLYTNLLSTKEFGDYALIMSLYALVAAMYQFGMQSGLTKFFIEERSPLKKKIIFSTILNFVLILGGALTALALFLSPWISEVIFNDSQYSDLIRLIFVALYFETAGYFFLHLLKTQERSKVVVIFSSIAAIMNLLLNVWLVYFLRLGVEGILLAQIISALILIIIVFKEVKFEYRFGFDVSILSSIIKFSYFFLAAGILTASVDVADRFILNHFLGKEEVGIYSFAYRIALIMNVFVISFRTAWAPRSLKLYYTGDYKIHYGNTFVKLVAGMGFIFLAVSLLTPELFNFRIFNFNLFNIEYESGIVILPFVLMGYFFNGFVSFYSVYPFVSNKSYHFLIADFLAFSVNIAFNFYLIPLIGITGAAIATTLALLTNAIYLFSIGRKKVEVIYRKKETLIIVLFTAAAFVVGTLAENIIVSTILLIAYLAVVYFNTDVRFVKKAKST